jgi:hypothetical protein
MYRYRTESVPLEDYSIVMETSFACPSDTESYAGGSVSS